MRKTILFICLLTIPFSGFSQRKKEQIKKLNLQIDSCKNVISIQLSDIYLLGQKLIEEQNNSQEKANQITLLNNEIDSLKCKIPVEAIFNFKVLKQAENRDQRYGNDSETEVYLMIQNQIVDTYSEFGIPELDSIKTQIYLTSELSSKNYEIIFISSTKVIVKWKFFCGDCDIEIREMEKRYQKNDTGIWKFLSCTGDCL